MLDILIPTYNRCEDLRVNIIHLINEIEKDSLSRKVRIIISDNCSSDNTEAIVRELVASNPEVCIIYYRQSENIGLEKNAVFVFQQATANHVMFIGDDDLIDNGYLKFCIEQININKQLGAVIAGIKSVNKKGDEKIGRNENYKIKYLRKGYQSILKYSHMAHQMSGLLIKNNDVLHIYLNKPENRNLYLFIFFTAHELYNSDAIYAPIYKTAVQIENKKDWSYNDIGLLDEVFSSYRYFEDELSERYFAELLVHFVRMHSYRLNIRLSRPILIIKYFCKLSELVPNNVFFKWKLAILLTKEYLLVAFRLFSTK